MSAVTTEKLARSQNLWVQSIRKSGVVSWECAGRWALRIGAIIPVEIQEEASVDATNHVTFCLDLGRGRVNTRNRNLWQEDYGVEKLDNSNATHLLTS